MDLKVKLTEKEGSYFNDKITLDVTPDMLEDIVKMYKAKCVNQTTMLSIECNIDKYKHFERAMCIYNNARHKKDK